MNYYYYCYKLNVSRFAQPQVEVSDPNKLNVLFIIISIVCTYIAVDGWMYGGRSGKMQIL
jgi:hypothetical protein